MHADTTIEYQKHQTEQVYYHDRNAAARGTSESGSEGMTNDASSCWMISVIQALRASEAFRKEFTPTAHEKNSLKKELFILFDIAEGKNGHKRRPVTPKEIRSYKRQAIDRGLPARMDHGFLEKPFLRFLLKNFDAAPVEYLYTSSSRKKRETILSIPVTPDTKKSSLQELVENQKITFPGKAKAPIFLPIYLKRSIIKNIATTAAVIPSSSLEIPIKNSKAKARYSLVSIVIGRDSMKHAYSYVFEKDTQGKKVWVEYNDSKVVIHKSPETKKRTSKSKHTPFEDACKHGVILVYDFIGIN